MRNVAFWFGVYVAVVLIVGTLIWRSNGKDNYNRRMADRVREVMFRTSFVWYNHKHEEAESMKRQLRVRYVSRKLALVAAFGVAVAVSACTPSPNTGEGGVTVEQPRVTLSDVKRFSRQLRAGLEASAVVILNDPKLNAEQKAKGEQALIAVRAADDEVQALTEGSVNARSVAKAMLATSMSALPLIPMKDSTRGYVTLAIAGLSAFVTLAPDVTLPATPTKAA